MHPIISKLSLSFGDFSDPEAMACLVIIDAHSSPLSWLESLSPKERLHYENYKFPMRQQQYLMGRYCAKLAISKQLTIPSLSSFSIDSGVFRQPIIRDIHCNGVIVSISHSEHSAIALAFYDRYACGVDIEMMSSQKAELIRPLLKPQEKGLLAHLNLSEEQSMLLAWSAKESLSKALRTGLSLPFELLEIHSIQNQGTQFEIHYKNFIQYSSLNQFHNGHIISITKPKGIPIHGLGLIPKVNQNATFELTQKLPINHRATRETVSC